MLSLTEKLIRIFEECSGNEFELPDYLERYPGTACDVLCVKPENKKNLDEFGKLRQEAQKIVNLTRIIIEKRDKIYQNKNSSEAAMIPCLTNDAHKNIKRLNVLSASMNRYIQQQERAIYGNGDENTIVSEEEVKKLNDNMLMYKNVQAHIKRLDLYTRAMGKLNKINKPATISTGDKNKININPAAIAMGPNSGSKYTSSSSTINKPTENNTNSIQIASANAKNPTYIETKTYGNQENKKRFEESNSEETDSDGVFDVFRKNKYRDDSDESESDDRISSKRIGKGARFDETNNGDNSVMGGTLDRVVNAVVNDNINTNFGKTDGYLNSNNNVQNEDDAYKLSVAKADNRKGWDDLLPIYEDTDHAEAALDEAEKEVDGLIDTLIEKLQLTRAKATGLSEALQENDEVVVELSDKVGEAKKKLEEITKTTMEVRKKLGGGAKVIFWIIIVLALIGIGYWCYSIIKRYS